MLAGFQDYMPTEVNFREAVLNGLSSTPKTVPSKWIYDARGSWLFEAVCEAPEYYPTRTELGLLSSHSDEIATLTGPNSAVVEFGSGAGQKTRLLLEALERPMVYIPIDIDGETLKNSAQSIAVEYPELSVIPVRADFTKSFPLPNATKDVNGAKLGFFPGATIGNFEPEEACSFFRMCAKMLEGGGLIVGADLKKKATILEAAYNDSLGACSSFNLNLIDRINYELNGNLNKARFKHNAVYQNPPGRMNIGIRSTRCQSAHIAGRDFQFRKDEIIKTQVSYKYTVSEFHDLAVRSGLKPLRAWIDDANLFSLHYFCTA